MMLNKAILADRAYKKIATEAFDAIIASTFIDSLPVDDDVRDAYTGYLYESASRFIDSCGGYTLLDRALENTTNKVSHALTNVIGDVVYTTANEVTTRVNYSNLNKYEENLPSALDKVAMTPEEVNKFKAKAENISMEEISNVIKDRTINAIKQERRMYEQEEETKQAIQDALDASEAFKGVTFEQFTNSFVKCNTNHDTLFSKLQTLAYENLIYKYPYDDNALFDTIDYIANECGTVINDFKPVKINANAALEEIKSYKSAVNEEIALTPEQRVGCMDDAMFAAMVVYCMMDTLNKLNFIKIDRDKLKAFIQGKKSANPNAACTGNVDNIKVAVADIVHSSTKDMKRGIDKAVLLDRIDALTDAKEALSYEYEDGTMEPMELFKAEHDKLDKAISALEAAVSVQPKGNTNKFASELDLDQFQRNQSAKISEANKMKCDRIGKMFGRFPAIQDILVRIDPNQNFKQNITIDIEGRTSDGRVQRTTTLTLNPDTTRPPVELIKHAIESSSICQDDLFHSVYMTIEDGYGRKTPLGK